MQIQQLKDLQDKTHKDLWVEDLDKFMEELDVSRYQSIYQSSI